MAWMSALAALAAEIMVIDGTAIRRSRDRADGNGAMHGVSAWAATHEVVRA